VKTIDRITGLLRANINDLLDRAEDPETMLNQIVRDMESAIREGREQVRDLIANEKMLHDDFERSRRLAGEWERKAEMAVAKGNDALALEALRRKKDFEAHAEVYKTQWDAQKQAVERFKQELQQLESRYEAAVRNREALLARRRRAVVREQLASTEARLTSIDFDAELERMERRIRSQEARAEATAEMADDSLDQQFRDLESEQDLQADLAALKAKVGRA
jgi:phage shock protein A